MPRKKASRFLGVHPSGNPRRPWTTQIVIPAGRTATFGTFRTEREAAVVYDRAVLFYRPHARRNFPDQALSPADEATLRAEARRQAKLATSSKYRGVMKAGAWWQANISVANEGVYLGRWRTERQAAEAFDRAALFFDRPSSQLNFASRRLEPLAPSALRRLAHTSVKETTSSKFRGVQFIGYSHRPWVASIGGLGPTGTLHLGTWEAEEDAGRAYDRAARFYGGREAMLNFPNEELEPADAATLMMEARRQAKRGQSSRYLGVHWSKAAAAWRAVILHSRRAIQLGTYTSERAAAEAYDAKSIELRGARARVNFDPTTGKHVWGTRLGELPGAPVTSRPKLRQTRARSEG